MSLLDGSALVTGGGSGIGRCLCIAYVRAGIRNITIADINLESAQKTAAMVKEAYPKAKTLEVTVDVVNEDSVQDMVKKHMEAFGELSCAANCAGITCSDRSFSEGVMLKEYERVMAVNATGAALCMKAELQVMLKQEPKETSTLYQDSRRAQKGSIVNFGSVCGITALPHIMPYIAAKHAVLGMTKTAAIEHGPQGVRINAVCPGLVETPFLTTLKSSSNGTSPTSNIFDNPMGRLCLPEEIADLTVFLSSTMSSYMNGASVVSDGGRSVAY